MASVDQNSNAVLQGIARHINCLGEENRNTRKKALEDIKKDTLKRNPALEESELHLVFRELLKPLLKVFSDPVEKCRNLAVDLIREFLKVIPKPEENLVYIMPVLVQRLGQQEIVENSEELRLILIELLTEVVEYSGKKVGVYMDDSVKILQRSIVDPYPEVKKESCSCASLLAKTSPEYFHMQSESLINPLLTAISHQHSKVRTIVIETIGNVIQYGNGKSVDTVVSHLAQRLFDQAPAVRMAVTKVVGHWLLDLPDRYSFHHKLIPLLLTSITDEQTQINETADSLWYDVGMKYEKENEEDFKDKLDFGKPPPEHYPSNLERPNLGCRTLVNRNLSKILPGLLKDVLDWVTATRIKSAALLYTLLLNTEDYITQHMEKLVTGMYRACVDEEQQVIKDIQRSAELVGYFVQPEVWCKLILQAVKTTPSVGPLMILAAVIRGSQRTALQPYLQPICDSILLPDVCFTVQISTQEQLLNVADAVITVSEEDVTETSQQLFTLLHNVLAQQQGDTIQDKVHKLLDRLAIAQKLESKQQLYANHTKAVIDSFQDGYPAWGTHSVERLLFDTILIESGPVVGELLDDIIPILVANLNPDKEAEVRLKFFSLLSRLMMNAAGTLDSKQKFGDFALIVVKDMLLPNFVWRAGRTAGAIRTTAVSSMWAMLQSGVLTKEKLEPVVEQLLTQLISSMDDDNKSTRLISCRVMTRLFDLMGPSLDQDRLHNLYPELLKRLDDSSDEIRVTVSKTFLAYLCCFQDNYQADLYSAHLEAIFQGLLVHLDDPDQKIQEAVLEVLKKAGEFKPQMLMQEIEKVQHKHRTAKYCQALTQHVQGLSIS